MRPLDGAPLTQKSIAFDRPTVPVLLFLSFLHQTLLVVLDGLNMYLHTNDKKVHRHTCQKQQD